MFKDMTQVQGACAKQILHPFIRFLWVLSLGLKAMVTKDWRSKFTESKMLIDWWQQQYTCTSYIGLQFIIEPMEGRQAGSQAGRQSGRQAGRRHVATTTHVTHTRQPTDQ